MASHPDIDSVANRSVVQDISAAQDISANFAPATSQVQARTADAAPKTSSVLDAIGGLISSVVANVGSAAFDTLQSVETVVTGPPVVPSGSHVTVRNSTIELDNGETVPANWYFPETENGAPPKQMILLQHGFLAQGPMYSYTAATIAEATGSIVVTPTLSSNPFAGDDFWLGGTGMSESIGHLFEGQRTALTQSALDAGYGDAYDFPEGTSPELPEQFALMGHSLGANLVSGAAGTLAADCDETDCAADDLVGVILLDGVPIGNTLPNALDELDKKEKLTGYIPVREIGAPLNAWNSLSSVNEQLTAARPNRFNGVVLDGGVHADAMSGGNPLIQFALYVAAGFPQPQNPPAVEQLSADWLEDWFAGDTTEGDGLDPGTTVDIDTPKGTAHGVVLGTPPPFLIGLFHALVTKLETATVTNIPSANPTLVTLAA
jgi:pimeloyl-ACP methyl ester carboxylesterase